MINKFSILNGASSFSPGIFQNYFAFKSAKKYIKYFIGTARLDSWKSNGMSEENIENITKSDSRLNSLSVKNVVLQIALIIILEKSELVHIIRYILKKY